jgi:hypothetical protein
MFPLKTRWLLITLIFINTIADADWQPVGNTGFSAGIANHTSLAISNGTPYVAYRDGGNSNKATVMKFNGSNWESVGSPGFSEDWLLLTRLALTTDGTPYVVYTKDAIFEFHNMVMKFNGSNWVFVGSQGFSADQGFKASLALSNDGTPYVAYEAQQYGYKTTVKKFNGSNWESVGSPGFTAGAADDTSLAISNDGTPYVAYLDRGNSDKASVMKFNGSNWESVGSPGFSAGRAPSTSLAFANGTPYVAYRDEGNSSKASVMKFNGSSWESVGSPGFSAGGASYTSLAISNETPYVAYMDGGNSDKATVMKFNGSNWESVGSPGFSAGAAFSTSLAFANGTLYVAYGDAGNSSKATVMKYVVDSDNDGVDDQTDNCPSVSNPDQADFDGDGIGDVCDPDSDNDGVNNDADQCLDTPLGAPVNASGCTDTDGDGIADQVDNCPSVSNPDQADFDGDGIGDVCDTASNGVCVLNYDTLPPQPIQVPRILNQLGTWEVPQPPEEPIWQGNGDPPSLENPWELEPVERFLGCYQVVLKNGRPVTRANCYAMIDSRIRENEEWATVKDAYWFPWADKCSDLRDANIIGSGVATLATDVDLQIKLAENSNEAQLQLTTSSEENTAEFLILRGNRLKNGGTEIKVACQFNSGHSPYRCTDQPSADTYRVVEKEYSGRLIVYDEQEAK